MTGDLVEQCALHARRQVTPDVGITSYHVLGRSSDINRGRWVGDHDSVWLKLVEYFCDALPLYHGFCSAEFLFVWVSITTHMITRYST